MKRIGLQRQQGFTLIELMIVVAAMGVVMVIFASSYSQVGSLRKVAAQERDAYQNMLVGQSLMEFAQRTDGRLPPQDNGSAIPILETGSAEDREMFLQALWSRGVMEHQALYDGTRAENPRLYRLVSDTLEVPVFGNSGDLVQLPLDYAAIYMPTETISASFDPRDLGTDDALDSRAFVFSNRSYQDERLKTTVQRLQQIRRAINSYVTLERLQAPPGELTSRNFMPGSDPGGSTSDCGGGWARLEVSTALNDIGMASSEFENTAWGAPIFYCRNYGARTSAPYYGALAIRKDVTDVDANYPAAADRVVISL